MWPQLVSFCHFGKILRVIKNFSGLSFNWQQYCAIGQNSAKVYLLDPAQEYLPNNRVRRQKGSDIESKMAAGREKTVPTVLWPHRWWGGGGNKNLAPGLNPRNKLFNVKKIGINLSFKAVWPDPRIKYCPIFPNSCPNSRHSSLTYKVTFFKIEQKVAKSLCYSGKRICHREISKIAQSGYTASQVHVRSRSEWIIKIRYLAMLMWIIIGVVVVVTRMMWLTRLRCMVIDASVKKLDSTEQTFFWLGIIAL